MDERYGVPAKVLLPYNRAKKIELPHWINCESIVLDDSDPYLIYRSAANKVINAGAEYHKMYADQMDGEYNEWMENVKKKPQFLQLLYLLVNKDCISSANQSEECATILLENEKAIGNAYLQIASDIL